MSDGLCQMCGLRNSPSANVCARCKEPLDDATVVAQSPFSREPTTKAKVPAPTAAASLAQTVIDLPIPARPKDRLPQELEATRVVTAPVTVPKEARPEPRPKTQGLPAPQSRVPTQPMPQASRRIPERPTAPVAEAPKRPSAQERTTLLDLMPEAEPAPRAQAVAPSAKAPLRARIASAPQAQEPAPTQIMGVQTHGLSRAELLQHLAANAIDAAVVSLMTVAALCLVITLGAHGYPNSHPTAFENFAIWLARSGSQPMRTFLLASVLLVSYGALGARRGATLGRAVMGLVLVSKEGLMIGWDGALWHGLGCALNICSLGAGSLWLLVDRWHRSWACLLSRTLVVPRHQIAPRS